MQQHSIRVSMLMVLVALGATIAFAQTDESEAERIRQQIKGLSERLEKLNQGTSDDFSPRVHAIGRSTTPPQPQEPLISIRLYDLSDLFGVSPQYPAVRMNEYSGQGSFFFENLPNDARSNSYQGGFGGGGMFSLPPHSPTNQDSQNLDPFDFRVSIQSLIDVIKSTVATEEWSEHGGKARIQQLGNTLIVRADETLHVNIENLLNLFREHWGKQRTVALQAYLIRSDPAAINKLLRISKNDGEGSGVVDETDWAEFLETAMAAKNLDCSTTLVGHNSQTLHAFVGRSHQIVVNGEVLFSRQMMFDANGESIEVLDHSASLEKPVGLSPEYREFFEGTVIQVTPFATRGGNFLNLDIQAKSNKLVPVEEQTPSAAIRMAKEDGNVLEMPLGRRDYQTLALNSTVRCPKGQIVLVGGMQSESVPGGDRVNLYLFVRGSIHTIEEDKSDRKPK